MSERHIISIWLPHWPMDRFLKTQDDNIDTPAALTLEGQHGPVIYDLTPAALAEGLRRNQRVVDAKTLVPQLLTYNADPGGDSVALRRLAAWCRRWSPWVSVDGADGLLIDASGCAHLFGGEAAMLGQIEARLKRLKLKVRTSLAPTRGAAWALARYGPARSIVSNEELAPALSVLPVAALRITPAAELVLRRVGLKTVGQLMDVPRAALTKRFGKGNLKTMSKSEGVHPLLRLDQALGVREDPLSPAPHRPRLRVVQPLLEPIAHVEAVEMVLEGLCARLCRLLEEAGQGTRAVKLEGYRVDGGRAALHVAVSRATRTAFHIRRLFKDKLETLDAGFGFDTIALEAVRTQPLYAVASDLSGVAALDGDGAQLLDRLSARLGAASVLRPILRESHIPERAVSWVRALDYQPPRRMPAPKRALRPHRLFDPPEEIQVTYGVPEDPPKAFVWRRRPHRVAKVEGPERLAPEWWRAGRASRLRDYYRIEDDTGRRYWLFRYGVYGDGRSEEAPRWYMHGMFG
ncbi:MAG: DNA polymerase Y family protein [Pseudomonadota bacterium]